MIEISHQQAQRMLRKRLDGLRLPEAQWAILQAHLEGCAECRVYAERRRGLERGLSASLRQRWSERDLSAGARSALSTHVLAFRARRAKWLFEASRVGMIVLALAVFGYLVYSQTRSLSPAAEPVVFSPSLEPEPTATVVDPRQAEDLYRGVFAYSAAAGDGQADIFLVNRREAGAEGAEITNLTNHPAMDIYPVWSPNGEWIVFLSNREPDGTVGNHFELYAVTVAGTRLTRLTNAPDIEWHGPLSWSSDGYMIALTGTRIRSGVGPFVYLVPVGIVGPDGSSAPRSLAGTLGVPGPLRFSPGSAMLAYTLPDETGGLALYHLSDRIYYPLTYHESAELKLKIGLDGAFDWLPNGWQVGYLARGRKSEFFSLEDPADSPEALASLRVSNSLTLETEARLYRTENTVHYRARGEDSLRGLAITSNPSRLLMAYLVDPGGRGCWQVEIYDPRGLGVRRTLEGFCVQGGLAHENWSTDGRWLIVSGAPAGEPSALGVYAARVPEDNKLQEDTYFARLMDPVYAPGAEGQREPILAQPLVRPSLPYAMEIDIEPAEENISSSLANARPPAPTTERGGMIVYEVRSESGSEIYSQLPDGSNRFKLASSGLSSACPALSPDGRRFAYLENSYQTFGVPAVIVADITGRIEQQNIASARMNDSGGLSMSCPVWSPDGSKLAWLSQWPNENFLKAVDVTDGEDIMVRIQEPALYSEPVWTPDSQFVLYSTAKTSTLDSRILAVPVVPDDQVVTQTLFEVKQTLGIDNYSYLLGLTYSNDGDLAFIQAGTRDVDTTNLIEMDPMGRVRVLSGLPGTQSVQWLSPSTVLEYLPDGSLIFATHHEVDALHKTVLWIYDSNERQRRPLAYLEDVLFDATLSPDGRWLAYSSDAGLYALDLSAARRDGSAAPALLSAEKVYNVQWK